MRELRRVLTVCLAITALLGVAGCRKPAVVTGEVSLATFAGNWVIQAEEGTTNVQDRVLRLELNGTRLKGTIDGEIGVADLGNLDVDTVTGKWTEADAVTPMTAQINATGDRAELKLTLAPPDSEYSTATAWKEGRVLADGSVVVLPAQTPGGEVPSTPGPVRSSDEAVARVAANPNVVDWLNLVKEKNPQSEEIIEVDSEDPAAYVVHVYEVVDDGGGNSHTATFGWYQVDKMTGAVIRTMP
jgi:hypothetical protein